MIKEKKEALKGGEFLIRETDPNDIFTPEEFDEEQQMIAETCETFLQQEVLTRLDEIDSMQKGLMPSLIEKVGELGVLGVSIPEEYGGFNKNFVTSMLTAERLGAGYSFSVAVSAHAGIGTLPILYYGTEEQKSKYIPKLASGEYKGAYCLTEPGSGSDANSGKTKATLNADGSKYILNGQKMWITNGGFADVFTVFAKIDEDENLSAFIVDASSEGITLNPEEKKMGIKGSSTCQIFFNNVEVPVENLLGQRNEGFKIALNILNIGRIKLAGAVIGGAKGTLTEAIRYANERNQFGRPISKYGAIRQKIAKMSYKTFACESAVYRASQNIEDRIASFEVEGMSKSEAVLKGIEAYAIECAMLKVHGSEVLDYVADESVQIFGGMGYSAESSVERAYRDSRINRIFEGTNEINRMLTVDMMLKKAMKGTLDLMGPAQAVAGELMAIPDFGSAPESEFEKLHGYIKNFKKAILMIAGSAVQKLMMELAKEQEILMAVADMLIETYVAESVLLRVEKRTSLEGETEDNKLKLEMARAYIFDAGSTINQLGNEALISFAEGDELRMMTMGLKRFTKMDALNIKLVRRNIAQRMIDENKYVF
ncbi:MAG TPA: acyl-CoA dehydrogenase [Flavobacteriales bacterium]|jgi:alkylation response protein AidB-like acyl-CoA dehydrogenase|nr:acyl-CoA dehydrogenase [Flavobacteriales bacterium]